MRKWHLLAIIFSIAYASTMQLPNTYLSSIEGEQKFDHVDIYLDEESDRMFDEYFREVQQFCSRNQKSRSRTNNKLSGCEIKYSSFLSFWPSWESVLVYVKAIAKGSFAFFLKSLSKLYFHLFIPFLKASFVYYSTIALPDWQQVGAAWFLWDLITACVLYPIVLLVEYCLCSLYHNFPSLPVWLVWISTFLLHLNPFRYLIWWTVSLSLYFAHLLNLSFKHSKSLEHDQRCVGIFMFFVLLRQAWKLVF